MVRYVALKSLYDVEKTIGTGGFAKVKLATHILTGEKVAIKIMDKQALGSDYPRVKMELEALKSISHHHICKLYQVIETATHFFMVMEYCSGGELFDHIVEKSKLTESEARCFFRQILSAVGYLHKIGFAHRDLKPENILLDKEHNLKLIDFGLCAKPNGGMASFLYTSCGSPTYAAPELIKGKKYLGSEIDVWSLGVLLYALLCGFLPFDSDSIDKLYHKILSGKYDEPPWLSTLSKDIIRQMLQEDPKKRISVEELLYHPWVTVGYYEAVSCDTIHKFHEKDDAVTEVIADYYSISPEELWSRINEWNYDYDTATYQLLLARKKRGSPISIRLNSSTMYRLRPRVKRVPLQEPLPPNFNGSPLSPSSRHSYCHMVESLNNNGRQPQRFPSEVSQAGDAEKMVTSNRKNLRKRTHATGEDDVISPIPSKLTNANGRRKSIPKANTDSPMTPSGSTPGSKLLCSIEKKFNQVRNVLTPKKRRIPRIGDPELTPCVLTPKGLCNVSTTSYSDPNLVLEDLKAALVGKGIVCQTEGFILRGKINECLSHETGKKSDESVNCKLSFELEVCYVKTSDNADLVVGVKRKRLKGDAWCYKRVCEQVLKLTNTVNS